jgi:hypothetical protein
MHSKKFGALLIAVLSIFFAIKPALAQGESATAILNGKTTITFSSEFLNALNSAGITVGRISPANESNGALSFPILTGTLDLGRVGSEMLHLGGFTLTSGQSSVELLNFITTVGTDPNTINGTLTGMVVINKRLAGRTPIFALGFRFIEVRASGRLTSPDINIKLTREAAGRLNTAFNTTVFAEGQTAGSASIKGRAERQR